MTCSRNNGAVRADFSTCFMRRFLGTVKPVKVMIWLRACGKPGCDAFRVEVCANCSFAITEKPCFLGNRCTHSGLFIDACACDSDDE
jgi:hypothetical protein